MADGAYKKNACSFNAATVILFFVFTVHVIGFAKPRWLVIEVPRSTLSDLLSNSSEVEGIYHGGLWQHCGCAKTLGTNECLCFSRTNSPGWFKFVQAAETLGLTGLIVSMILSLLLCFRQTRKCKRVNILIVITSGALILVGTLVFVNKTKEHFRRNDTLLGGKREVDWRLGYSFILCTVASCFCLFVCVPLYLKDCSHTPETSPEAPVHNIETSPQQDNLHGGHPAGYAPVHYLAQPPLQDYVQGGKRTGYAPAYNIAQQPQQDNVQGGHPAWYAPVNYTAQPPPQGIVQGGQTTGDAPAFFTGQPPLQGNAQGGQPTGYAPLYYIDQPLPQGYVQVGQPAGYVPASAPAQYGSPPASDQPDDSKIPLK